ncbi:MAG: hypothetical protein ABL930_06940 [Pseudobdellovibrio sp.]
MTILKVLLFFVITFSFVEIGLRVPGLVYTKENLATTFYLMKILDRINPMWVEKENLDPYSPPFEVFANIDISNEARLTKINTLLRKNISQKFESYDFLKPEIFKEKTKYRACVNNFGFRSCTDFKALKKNSKSFRIITYGSYQAFGHGLDEKYTYSSVLENKLQSKFKKNNIEVWNSAHHAATAITGISHLKYDIEHYKPDLVIFDFGFVDPAVLSDNYFPYVMHFSPEVKKMLKPILLALNYFISKSVAGFKLWNKFGLAKVGQNIINFQTSMNEFLDIAQKANTQVIVIKQIQVDLKRDVYTDILTARAQPVIFIDADDIYKPVYAKYVSLPVSDTFWLNEVKPEQLAILQNAHNFRYPRLRLDFWQINEYGQEILAEALTDSITNSKFVK